MAYQRRIMAKSAKIKENIEATVAAK